MPAQIKMVGTLALCPPYGLAGYPACAGYDERKRSSIQRPLAVGPVERERRHVDLEPLAALALHFITPGHETGRGRKRHAAGVFEALARREHGLLADHALAADLLFAARGVGNDPVPAPQLHGLLAAIGDDDGVGPEILAVFDRRAFRQEVRLDGDFDLAGKSAVQADALSESLKHHPNRKFFRHHTPPPPA